MRGERAGPGPPWGRSLVARVAMTAAIAWFQVVGTTFASHDQPEREPLDALAYTLLVIGPAALFFRRRYPVAVLTVTLGATLVYWLLGYPEGPIFIALVIAFVTAVMKGHRAAAWATIPVGYVGFLWGPYLVGDRAPPGLGESLGVAAWLLVVAVGADMARTRRQHALEERRHREEEERRRAADERLRIARELHDVLAHSISLINVQAGVALHLMDEKPEQARMALSAIKEASRSALQEVHSVLGVLRQEGEVLPRAPASSLARLDEVIASMAAAGIAVETDVDGSPVSLPTNIDLAAFRIIQEALTNVARHSGATTAKVRIGYADSAVTVEVLDEGHGSPARHTDGSGSGIAGMRERATALGGTFEAGPRPGRGFRVWARLPLGETP